MQEAWIWALVGELRSCMWHSVQFSSVAQSCLTLCDPMNCSTLGLPVHHQLPEFTETHIHWVSDAIQPSHPLSSPSPPAPNPSQHQSLFQWVNSLHGVAKFLRSILKLYLSLQATVQWLGLCIMLNCMNITFLWSTAQPAVITQKHQRAEFPW